MARDKTKTLARVHGIRSIVGLVNRLGSQKEAASQLGISQPTLSTFLKDNGYEKITIYRKREEKTA